MTKEEEAKWAELYKAYADGKIIQYKPNTSTAWYDTSHTQIFVMIMDVIE